jgi:pimeloyl-ACP methyl ester carboxylesterase
MLLVNPGGPGNTGVNFILEIGSTVLVPVVGTNFDIVSFDPRGMGHSLPVANCSQSANSNNKVMRRAYGLYGPEEPESYWAELFVEVQASGAQCAEAIGGPDGAGVHMSTPVVTADMISMVDAFAATARGTSAAGNSSLLNYWGFSYGTFLGETFATLYPDRVGRVTLDGEQSDVGLESFTDPLAGVVDPEDYTGQLDNSIGNTDAIMGSFFTYCHLAGPDLCAFYTGTAISDISIRFENLFTSLNATDAVARNFSNATLIVEVLTIMKTAIRPQMYTPITSFPILAQQLVAYESALQNLTLDAITAASQLGTDNTPIPGVIDELPEWQSAVLCTDRASIYNETYQAMRSNINTIVDESFVVGDIWAGYLVIIERILYYTSTNHA